MGKFEQIIEARQKLYSLSEAVPPDQQQRRPPVWGTAQNQQAGQQAGATGAQQGSAQVGQVATDATAPVPPPPPGDAQGVAAAAPGAASPAPATPSATTPAGGTAPATTQTPTVATNVETKLQSEMGMSPEQAKKAAQIVNSIQNGQV